MHDFLRNSADGLYHLTDLPLVSPAPSPWQPLFYSSYNLTLFQSLQGGASRSTVFSAWSTSLVWRPEAGPGAAHGSTFRVLR